MLGTSTMFSSADNIFPANETGNVLSEVKERIGSGADRGDKFGNLAGSTQTETHMATPRDRNTNHDCDPSMIPDNPLGRPATDVKYKPCTASTTLCICALLLPDGRCSDHNNDGNITTDDMIERCTCKEWDTNDKCQFVNGEPGETGNIDPGFDYGHNQGGGAGREMVPTLRIGILVALGWAIMVYISMEAVLDA
ncbi:hypothetical protein MKZ38_007906 [Zalerion maritima]|uniref:Uncharacterized protein n=1 Tax=Zalerion maritima TaxID=339359 RepID=A0AAD5RLN7_9PEZI|nr:hypothetical protein MKZ38_007906 [Zalerion maritima]